MHALLTMSGIALAIMAVLAIALGWLVAGRVLRPLRTMTTTTQRITEHNLHERLALPGPSDELKDLADTIDGLLNRLEAAFDAQRRFVANAPAPAIGDPHLARRLVANLLDNALRHNITGGHINIATRTESRHAVLTIANSGPIIPPADIDRLFQPFQRLHGDRANHPDGHGLGLSIVQSIAAAHGAPLSARTRPDGGLHVEVRFPPYR